MLEILPTKSNHLKTALLAKSSIDFIFIIFNLIFVEHETCNHNEITPIVVQSRSDIVFVRFEVQVREKDNELKLIYLKSAKPLMSSHFSS